jgi:hypothetical protein
MTGPRGLACILQSAWPTHFITHSPHVHVCCWDPPRPAPAGGTQAPHPPSLCTITGPTLRSGLYPATSLATLFSTRRAVFLDAELVVPLAGCWAVLVRFLLTCRDSRSSSSSSSTIRHYFFSEHGHAAKALLQRKPLRLCDPARL